VNEHLEQEAWFCVRSQPKSEHIAASHLRQMKGVQVYCPRLRFRKLTRRGPVWFAEALFPGYFFARFVPLVSQKEVTYARGVSGLVHFGGRLATIPDSTIADLRAHMGEEDCRTIDQQLRQGDSVTITGGVFKGLVTVVTQLLPARERVRVLIEFLGGCREVEVAEAEVLPEQNHLLSIHGTAETSPSAT
jgi:transcriptional antiterminator RfaH